DLVNLRAATLVVEDELGAPAAPLDLPCLEAAPVDVALAGAPGGLTAWDVTTPATPADVPLRAEGGQVVLPGFTPGRRYVLFDPARAPYPDDHLTLAAPATVLDQAGTLLVVAAPLFQDGLGPWLAQVTAEGWAPVVRTPRELYQTFTAGRPTPAAISAYLAHAQARWTAAPRALLIVGDATPVLDGGAPAFHVPTTYVYWPGDLWAASDLAFAFPGWSGNADPGPARVAVGRIAARTADEAQAALGRSLLHRATQSRAVLFLSDDNDASFRAAAEAARAALPAGLETQALHLLDYDAQYPSPDPAPPQWEEPAVIALRADLRAALASGVRLVQYFGHGDLNHVGGEGILDQGTELDNLTEMLAHGGLPPIFVLHDCLSGSFGAATVPHAIGESMTLLTDPSLGAAAVISPAGLTVEPLTSELALALEAGLTAQPTLGAALAAAVQARLADSSCFTPECRVTAVTLNLLGDPTLPSLAAAAGSAP
ncbi:MAG TPA: C25 family cysteine peptidase, partial [Polyangia bacterium]